MPGSGQIVFIIYVVVCNLSFRDLQRALKVMSLEYV